MISVGIIGAGGIANSMHLPSLKEIPGVKIIAICDIRYERARLSANKFNIEKVYSNYMEMLHSEKPDCVFVLTEPDCTFRIALDCLNYGLDVFIEKPAGITLFQTKQLKAALNNNQILQVGMNRRYIPLIQTVIQRMRAVTPITQVEGCFVKHGDAAFYGGCASAFICDTIHSIDLLSYIANSIPIKGATVISQTNSDVENAWNSVIGFENGITGVIKANYQTGARVHTFEIHGLYASAYINIGFGEPRCDATVFINSGSGSFSLSSVGTGEFTTEYYDGLKLADSDEYHKFYGYYQEDCAFINSIKSRENPISDINAACASMELAEFILNHRI